MSALDGLREVIELVHPGLAVIYAHQVEGGAPRQSPSVAIQIVQSSPVSKTPLKAMTDIAAGPLFELHRSWLRSGTARADFFGPDAVTQAEELSLALSRQDVKEVMETNGITLAQVGAVLRVPDNRGVNWETRAQIDLTIRFVDSDIEEIEDIQTVTYPVTVV